MKKHSKGYNTRTKIITEARKLLNEKGLGLTLDSLSLEMGLSRGRITNYFRTKDSLLLGIMRSYEHALGTLLLQNEEDDQPGFLPQYRILSKIMDVQYEYRCAIAYLSVSGRHQPEVHLHVESSFLNRLESIRMRLSAMVAMELLIPDLLKQPHLDMYCFQYTTLLTTWVICQEMYYSKRGFEKMKPIYLKSIMNLYIPYLTKKGKIAFELLDQPDKAN